MEYYRFAGEGWNGYEFSRFEDDRMDWLWTGLFKENSRNFLKDKCCGDIATEVYDFEKWNAYGKTLVIILRKHFIIKNQLRIFNLSQNYDNLLAIVIRHLAIN